MESLEPVLRLFAYMPLILWSLVVATFEWLIPRSWYAKDVSNDIVLITGAGSGLGRCIALEYAKLNASVVLWDINDNGLRETKELVEKEHAKVIVTKEKSQDAPHKSQDTGKRFCLTYHVDVSDKDQVKNMAEKVYSDLNLKRTPGQDERYVSVLVNNAGIYHGLMLQDLKDEQIERIFKINIISHFWMVRQFLPNMMKHERGHIVEVASMGGFAGLLKQVDYCATKFATVGFEESLSIELNYMGFSNKIFTTVVCPFFFSSNLFTGFNTSAASLMTAEFVASETVLTMRCNHSRVLLPQLSAYALFMIRTYMPRQAMILWTRALGLDKGIEDIRGRAAVSQS